MSHEAPQIYIACLAAYNAGKLHGSWVTVDGDADDLEGEIKKIIATSPEPDAEEWAIHGAT
ncbi:antirestriction protein ArdA [Scytonema sp. PCC 10023]|uniref:antirestriction protein ArdA n=1 Tax=Scytonema sp. PCC 10023 TaxID=1680591 RepID=UPI0039C67A22